MASSHPDKGFSERNLSGPPNRPPRQQQYRQHPNHQFNVPQPPPQRPLQHHPLPPSTPPSNPDTDRLREGYDTDLFVPAADVKYICPICTMVCRKAMQTECGHRFCDYCIRKWIRVQSKCPVDNAQLDEKGLFPDKIASREIMDLIVQCHHYKEGCTFTGELADLQAHLVTCDYESVACVNGCGQFIQRRLLQEHQKTGCSTTCKYCFQAMPISQRDKHMSECEYNDFKCPACGEGPFLVREREHHAEVCPKAEVQCQLYSFGCHEKLLREDLHAHSMSHTAFHIDILAQYLQQLHATSSTTSHYPGNNSGDICMPQKHKMPPLPPAYYANNAPTHSSFDEQLLMQNQTSLPSMNQTHSAPFGTGHPGDSGIESLAQKSYHQDVRLAKQDQHVLELQAKVQYLEKKIKEQSGTIRQQHDMINDLESRCSGGLYHWKITEYARRSREAQVGTTTVLHSPGFYSSFRGYKMCLRVNLNGVETGHGTHLSLFVHLMRGDFDDWLRWPFTGKITLSIINQLDESKHIAETLEGNESIAAFHRPMSSRNHKGFGYMEFVALDRIEGKSFVKNDTLIIRCQIQEL